MSETATRATISDWALDDCQQFDVPFVVARLLREAGIECRTEGVHGGIIDTEYRVVIEPPYEVWRDQSEKCWRVLQGSNHMREE